MSTLEPTTADAGARAPAVRRLPVEPGVAFGLALFAALLVVNLVVTPGSFSPSNLTSTIGLAAPVVLAAFAVTPTLLVGNGGIDLSVGPAMGLVNVVVVHEVIERGGTSSPVVVVAAALLTGAAVGLVNGLVIAYVRVQPIVATLGTYLICAGLTVTLLPTPGGATPGWLDALAGGASIVPIAVVLLLWGGLTRLPFHRQLLATGDDERTAYTCGIDTARIRVAAFVLGGLIAGVGGLALSAVLGSADPTVGSTYTLTGIAAAALGGVSLAGGRGGLLRALVGALTIFLLQNLLTYLNVSPFLLQVAYGAVLVAAVALNGQAESLLRRWRA